MIIHRIEQVQNDDKSGITKGDANGAADLEPISQENIIGIYSGCTIPFLRYVFNYVN